MKEMIRGTVPEPARSTKNSFTTTSPSSVPPQIQTDRLSRRAAPAISPRATRLHKMEIAAWNRSESNNGPAAYRTPAQKWTARPVIAFNQRNTPTPTAKASPRKTSGEISG